jgi:hypothetical protein
MRRKNLRFDQEQTGKFNCLKDFYPIYKVLAMKLIKVRKAGKKPLFIISQQTLQPYRNVRLTAASSAASKRMVF